jgi:hypothetical protein
MVLGVLETLVGHVRSLRITPHAGQLLIRLMAHGEESLSYLLVGSGSSREAKARYDPHRVDGHKEAKAFVPP